MARARTATVVAGLIFVGLLLGAIAGILTFSAWLFSGELRHGRVTWPVTEFVSFVGGLIGGGLGAILASVIAFSPWRYVPIGRLFARLTLGTVIGGCGASLVGANPIGVILCALVGFLIAGDRLAAQANVLKPAAGADPRAPAG